jgi:hypothetical protein
MSIGRSLAAMAAASLIMIPWPSRNIVIRPDEPTISNEYRRQRGKNKKGPAPNGETVQGFDRARLIVDRGSSFKKLRRWARRYPDRVQQPTEAAKLRHGWYRRQKAWDALRESLPNENRLDVA